MFTFDLGIVWACMWDRDEDEDDGDDDDDVEEDSGFWVRFSAALYQVLEGV